MWKRLSMASPDYLLKKLPPKFQTICVLIGGMLIHMTIGGLDASYGNIIPYVTSYLKKNGRDKETIDYNLMLWIVALFDAGIAISSIFGGLLEKKCGERTTVLLAAFVTTCGSGFSYFAIQKSFYLWLLTYGLINGIGMGLAYNTVLVCSMKWLPKNRGLASGLIQFGYSIGSSIFVAVQTSYVNPHNYQPGSDGFFTQEAVLINVPSLFLLVALIMLVMNMIGCLLLMDPKHAKSRTKNPTTPLLLTDEPQKTDYGNGVSMTNGKLETQISSISTFSQSERKRHVSPRHVLMSSTFWCLWLTWIGVNQPTNFIISYYKVFGQTFISNDILLTTLGSTASLTSGTSRIIWGCIADRYSYQCAMMWITGLMTVLISTMCITQYVGPALYFVWVLLIHFSLGGPFTLCPMAVTNAFGETNATINNGLFLSSMGVSTVLSAVLATVLLGRLDFCRMFVLMGGFGFLALLISSVIHRTEYGHRISSKKE